MSFASLQIFLIKQRFLHFLIVLMICVCCANWCSKLWLLFWLQLTFLRSDAFLRRGCEATQRTTLQIQLPGAVTQELKWWLAFVQTLRTFRSLPLVVPPPLRHTALCRTLVLCICYQHISHSQMRCRAEHPLRQVQLVVVHPRPGAVVQIETMASCLHHLSWSQHVVSVTFLAKCSVLLEVFDICDKRACQQFLWTVVDCWMYINCYVKWCKNSQRKSL